jgi:hypothetical protein
MNKLPYLVYLIVFFVPFLVRERGGLGLLPGPTVLMYELIAGLIFVCALIYGGFHKTLNISPKYIFLFIVICLHFLAGAILNSMDPATVLAGLRTNLKYVPLFLLPLVYAYSDKELTGQLKFLVALALLQFPLAIIQFFILGWSEDVIAGTLVIGSILSIFLVSCITVLTAFYFREKISGKTFIVLAFILFIPTTLNESKGTILLLIFGLMIIFLGANLKRSQLVMATSVFAIMLAAFTVIYNMHFDSVQGKGGLISFYTSDHERGLIRYLYSGDSVEIDPETVLEPPSTLPGALPSLDPHDYRTRRIDSIILPLRALSDDPARLFIGVGIGNASKSIGRQFSGEYSFLEEYRILGSALSRLLWEIGILGVFLYLLFFIFIYMDARRLSHVGDISGALALGWTGVVGVIVLSLPYKNIIIFEAVSAIFWYLSGYIVARTYVLGISHSAPSQTSKVIETPVHSVRTANHNPQKHGRL